MCEKCGNVEKTVIFVFFMIFHILSHDITFFITAYTYFVCWYLYGITGYRRSIASNHRYQIHMHGVLYNKFQRGWWWESICRENSILTLTLNECRVSFIFIYASVVWMWIWQAVTAGFNVTTYKAFDGSEVTKIYSWHGRCT